MKRLAQVRALQALDEAGLPKPTTLVPASSVTNEVWLADDLVVRINRKVNGRLRREATLARFLPAELGYPPVVAYGGRPGSDWLIVRRLPGHGAVALLADDVDRGATPCGEPARRPPARPALDVHAARPDAARCAAAARGRRRRSRAAAHAGPRPPPRRAARREPLRRQHRGARQRARHDDPSVPTTPDSSTATSPSRTSFGTVSRSPRCSTSSGPAARPQTSSSTSCCGCAPSRSCTSRRTTRAQTRAADYLDVPRWLADDIPELFSTPRLFERLTLYAIAYDVRELLAHPPAVEPRSLSPYHPLHRLQNTLRGASHLAWLERAGV